MAALMLPRRLPFLLALLSSTLMTSCQQASVDDLLAPGVSRDLAKHRRARIQDLHYRLHFRMVPGMEAVEGRLQLQFQLLQGGEDLALDFDGELLPQWRCNGAEMALADMQQVANHWMLPAASLQPGMNQVEFGFRSKVAATGTPLNVYRDEEDGGEYYYTLVVPADAHRLFPCFDQPDLKAKFEFSIEAPTDWQVVANGPLLDRQAVGEGRHRHDFQASKPISTYLMAFAAGPFEVTEPPVGGDLPFRIWHRASAGEAMQVADLTEMHLQTVQLLEQDFQVPYPFEKLDVVLLPGFPYGGMEHPGCIFYRESALVFDHTPTAQELLRRSTLIYHEVSHQWFGNLVTMEWFDDLWLKEGFATFIGYQVLQRREPELQGWLRFHQRVKPPAYQVDATPGTVPVYQELGNLFDAKSNYGPIVYNKAPSMLKALHALLGDKAFFDGVHRFLVDHAWDNATWEDLILALQEASGRDLQAWSERWLLTAGMPKVRAHWQEDVRGRLQSFQLQQEGLQGQAHPWPMQVDLLWQPEGAAAEILEIPLQEFEQEVEALVGQATPAWLLLNAKDRAYGRFLLDPVSRRRLAEELPEIEDPMIREVAFTAMVDALWEGEWNPRKFVQAAEKLLGFDGEGRDLQPRLADALSHSRVLQAALLACHRFLQGDEAKAHFQYLLHLTMQLPLPPELKLPAFRTMARYGSDAWFLDLCRDAARQGHLEGGPELGTRDRFLAAAVLLAHGDPEAETLLAELEADESLQDRQKYAFMARAASPDPAQKQRTFEAYLQLSEPPEQWIQLSLEFFHWPGQEELCFPYLRQALDRVLWVKEHRKIFFMPAWIDAFINAHSSPQALEVVEDFLQANPDLPLDVRRKLWQSTDRLRRVLQARQRFP
ncbi:MAG: hypothetical protein DWQ01_16530 [Planctomycetota bacterium]|nr:MAG: hypothetical protein DWQ01_16530 [Planctomycetota bacterium]